MWSQQRPRLCALERAACLQVFGSAPCHRRVPILGEHTQTKPKPAANQAGRDRKPLKYDHGRFSAARPSRWDKGAPHGLDRRGTSPELDRTRGGWPPPATTSSCTGFLISSKVP
jgi:hypothetical protein